MGLVCSSPSPGDESYESFSKVSSWILKCFTSERLHLNNILLCTWKYQLANLQLRMFFIACCSWSKKLNKLGNSRVPNKTLHIINIHHLNWWISSHFNNETQTLAAEGATLRLLCSITLVVRFLCKKGSNFSAIVFHEMFCNRKIFYAFFAYVFIS